MTEHKRLFYVLFCGSPQIWALPPQHWIVLRYQREVGMLLGHFIFFPFFGFGFVMYFLPSIIALARSKRDTLAIFLLNLFLGWSVIGWIVALVWAAKSDVPLVAR